MIIVDKTNIKSTLWCKEEKNDQSNNARCLILDRAGNIEKELEIIYNMFSGMFLSCAIISDKKIISHLLKKKVDNIHK